MKVNSHICKEYKVLMKISKNSHSSMWQRKKIAILLLFLFFIVVACCATVAVASLSFETDLPIERVTPYPYQYGYTVQITPNAQLYVGSVSLYIALESEDMETISVITTDDVTVMNLGETKETSELRAKLSLFERVIFETNYYIQATYQGSTQHSDSQQKHAVFEIIIKTSSEMPAHILKRITPSGILITDLNLE
jgi:hypothetical protein